MANFTIKPATSGDVSTIYDYIMKMARYERLENEVDITIDRLNDSLFVKKEAEAVIAYLNGKPVGFALFFHNFSTFMAKKGLYIEDIFIDKEFRGQGFGKLLFLHLAHLASQRGCRRMEWIVLDWNTPSVEFYKSLGAVPMDDWTIFRLNEENLKKLNRL